MFVSALIVSMSLGLADKEVDKLQGTWQVQKLVGKGKEVDPEKAKAITFVIEGDRINRFVNGVDSKDPAKIGLARTAKGPHTITLQSEMKGDPPQLGIYELDGDTVKWCFSPKKRPDKFESPEGSDATLIILKRMKK